MAHAAALPAEFHQVLLETYDVNDHIDQLILEHLDPRAWRAKPPGRPARTIAAIFAHVHNVRCKWLRLSALYLELPAKITGSGLGKNSGRIVDLLALAEAQPGATRRGENFSITGSASLKWPKSALFSGRKKVARLISWAGTANWFCTWRFQFKA